MGSEMREEGRELGFANIYVLSSKRLMSAVLSTDF